jgi:NADH-quinone oxidoreductase subunit E
MSLSEATRQSIGQLVALYPERRTALLPALKVAQAEVGYLPPEVIAETADLVGVPHSAALELAVFYTMLHTEPGPATRVVVCAQLPCALRGAEGLIRDLHSGLATRIAEGSLEVERTSECFGACHRAPMARVGDEYRESLDTAARQQLIAELSGSNNGRTR